MEVIYLIQLDNVYFYYKKEKIILNNIKYTFEEGKKYIIQGHNGSGKTTLLRLLCGLIKPTDGNIYGINDNIISFLPDNNGIYEKMTVLENIKFRISLYKLSYAELEGEVNFYLDKYGLSENKNTYIVNLSLGMKKKVALICAYIVKPDILILDEPTGGIDDKSRSELINMLNNRDSHNTITIVTSHDIELIENIRANRLFLEDGIFKYENTI